jgi:hypothetical protein
MSGLSLFLGTLMLYLAYFDEFGHVGPFISSEDSKHNTHPVFGLGGLVLPSDKVRHFSTWFFKLKNKLLDFELKQSAEHPAKWEKKGSSLYTVRNVTQYRVLRQATFTLLNKIRNLGGFTIHVGVEKRRDVSTHNSKKLFHSVLRELIKRLDEECKQRGSNFMMVLDEQEQNVMRKEIVETASLAMFGPDFRARLIEPPMQVESHLYQTVQCADWLCGLFGRLSHFECSPDDKPDFQIFQKYFLQRTQTCSLRSGLRRL